MKKFVLFLLIIALFSVSLVQAQEVYQLPLLAVHEIGDDLVGSSAELLLELRPGSGRVFLETRPLTKLDTQISTRFANDVACNQFNLPCDKFDFIYTINAQSNIIGGPSAGAALAALTTVAVLDLPYDNNIAVTGTINSGGTVGPVGGVKEKLEAAANAEMKTVLIPAGATAYKFLDNTTIDLLEFAVNNLTITAEEVKDLDDVLFILTGEMLRPEVADLTENGVYTEIMEGLQSSLCERSERIKAKILEEEVTITSNASEAIKERQTEAAAALAQKDFYSAASFCFNANIQLKTAYYNQIPIPLNAFNSLGKRVDALERKVSSEEITTISDLQTLMIVKERLQDVREQIIAVTESGLNNEEKANILAYAEERYYSALSWMQFFEMDGKNVVINDELLAASCSQKIFEAEERHQYARLFLGDFPLINIQEKIISAQNADTAKEYALCLITASQAKADANAVLSSFGVREEIFNEFLEGKQQAVEREIARNSAEGVFPILGYSYYQYANSLSEDDFTPLVYYEYALEMSDLSIYFPEKESRIVNLRNVELSRWLIFVEGLVVGIIIGIIIFSLFFRYYRKKYSRK